MKNCKKFFKNVVAKPKLKEFQYNQVDCLRGILSIRNQHPADTTVKLISFESFRKIAERKTQRNLNQNTKKNPKGTKEKRNQSDFPDETNSEQT